MLNVEEIKSLIPQRYPFLMLDRVIDIKEGGWIKAYKNISINEEFFRGHFPNTAILPGALIVEAMAQAACVLLKKSIPGMSAALYYITSVKVRFLKPVVPGDRLNLLIKIVKAAQVGGICETEAAVDNEVVAKGEMTFAAR